MGHAGSYRVFAVVLGLGLACALGVQADTTYTFDVAGEANATVTTGLDTITITLTDLYVNPGSVTNDLSAFWFTTSTTPTSASIASSSADAIDIGSNGRYTNAGTVSPGWVLSTASAVTKLDDLTGGAGPAHTIVGAPGSGNDYSNANRSIAGNGPHNDFLDQTATWTLTEDGVTAATVISNAYFQFGTTDGHGVVGGTAVSVTQVSAVPEPATMALLFAALPLIFLARKYRSH